VRNQVFVYGTLLAGEVNHHLLAEATLLGGHRTEPCFTMFSLDAYPGVARGGGTAIVGDVYQVDTTAIHQLDRLEGYPRLYERVLIPSPFGHAWIYLYRGDINGRPVIGSGDWRSLSGARSVFAQQRSALPET